MAEKQVFIIGTGRSGSTVLRKILGRHTDIFAFPGEIRFLTDRDGLFDLISHFTDQWNPFNASLAIHRFRHLLLEELWSDDLYQRVKSSVFVRAVGGTPRRYDGVDLSEVIPRHHCHRMLDKFIDSLATARSGRWYGSPSYQRNPTMYVTTPQCTDELYARAGQFVDGLLSYPLQEDGKTCWCDDTPINVLNANEIARMFDHPRLIHLYRDPRDVVASYADEQQAWGPDNPAAAATWVLEIMRKWWTQRDEMPAHSFLEVRYEDLVRRQSAQMRDIADFLGVRMEESLTSVELRKTSIGRHKRDLPPEVRSKVASIVQPILDEYGYT